MRCRRTSGALSMPAVRVSLTSVVAWIGSSSRAITAWELSARAWVRAMRFSRRHTIPGFALQHSTTLRRILPMWFGTGNPRGTFVRDWSRRLIWNAAWAMERDQAHVILRSILALREENA